MDVQCRLFQEVWREGVPVVVRGVRKGYQWNPITMCRATTENNSRFDGEQEIEVRHWSALPGFRTCSPTLICKCAPLHEVVEQECCVSSGSCLCSTECLVGSCAIHALALQGKHICRTAFSGMSILFPVYY